jgi:hypothetical protein
VWPGCLLVENENERPYPPTGPRALRPRCCQELPGARHGPSVPGMPPSKAQRPKARAWAEMTTNHPSPPPHCCLAVWPGRAASASSSKTRGPALPPGLVPCGLSYCQERSMTRSIPGMPQKERDWAEPPPLPSLPSPCTGVWRLAVCPGFLLTPRRKRKAPPFVFHRAWALRSRCCQGRSMTRPYQYQYQARPPPAPPPAPLSSLSH